MSFYVIRQHCQNRTVKQLYLVRVFHVVVDTPAHDEQRKTGTKWVVDVEGHWE